MSENITETNTNKSNLFENKYCSICHNFLNKDNRSNIGFCCKNCLDLFNLNLNLNLNFYENMDNNTNLTDQNIIPIYSFYTYQNMIRDLILRVKIKKDFIALNIIKDLFMMNIENTGILKKIDVDIIVPTYSSLWSRIRGKFDIAYFLATALSSSFNIPMSSSPLRLGWNLIKRSKNKYKDQNKNKDNNTNNKTKHLNIKLDTNKEIRKHVLIVDDIITTGDTLKKLSTYFSQNKISFISFARSSNFKEKYIKLST